MHRGSSSRSFGIALFRKPAHSTRKTLFLVMVPFVFLAFLYRSQNYVTVPESSQWLLKQQPVEFQPEQAQIEDLPSEDLQSEETVPHKISLAALTGNPLDEGEVDEAELATSEPGTPDTSPFDEAAPFNQPGQSPANPYFPQHESADDVTIVAARQGADSTDWIEEFCDDYLCNAYIYDIDEEPGPEFYVPHTLKGHEASAYLSYIVDYYDELAPYTIFLHGRPEHWHNDIAGPETKNVLVNLRYEAVSLKGYVNLRCMQTPGCPSTLFQTDPVGIDLDYEYMIQQMPKVLWELLRLDASEVPEDIGHQCCAQFALTKEKIRERPKSDYIRILHWVATTDMTDNYGIGWLVEKLWHLIFGMPAIYCLSEEQCRCDLYGWCGPNPLTHNRMLTPISYQREIDGHH